MSLYVRLTALVWLAAGIATSRAQDEPADPGALPEVVVEPDEGATLPPLEVRPDEPTAPGPFEIPSLFPGLSDQEFGLSGPFGGLSGALRDQKSLFDTAAPASIVSRDVIQRKQASDMFGALQNEVGVLMQQTAAGQSSPFVRGLTGQQLLILVDGIRLNNSIYRFGPNQYLNTIDPGMVDHIEVLRGQGSVLWGSDAVGGTINIITRGPDVSYGLCCGNYLKREFHQTYNTSNASSYSRLNVEGWTSPTSGFFTGGSFLNVRDIDTGFDFGRQPGTNYQQYAGDIKFNYLISPCETLTVSLQHFEQENLSRSDRFPGFPGDLDDTNDPAGARFFDPQQRDLAYLRYQALHKVLGFDVFSFTASYHRQREIQTRGIPTSRFQETNVKTVGLNMAAAKQLGPCGKLITGVDWYHDDVDSAFGGTASGPIIPDDAYYERAGWFLSWDVPLTCCLDATAGVRYEHVDLAATPEVDGTPVFIAPDYDDWVGQVGLVYKLAPSVHLVGSIAEGFRAPNLDELTANNPNVLQQGADLPSLGLAPEHSVAYDLGVKTDFEGLRTQTYIWWIDLADNIVPIAAGANQFRRDNQDSIIEGVEFDGELLMCNGWSLFGNFWYTLGKNRVTGAPTSRIPPTQGTLGMRWRDPCRGGYLSLYTWIVRHQDRLDPVRDIGDERIPPGGTPGYTTLNLRWGRSFGHCHQHRVRLSVENLTDEDYLVHGSGVFGTGITAVLGFESAW